MPLDRLNVLTYLVFNTTCLSSLEPARLAYPVSPGGRDRLKVLTYLRLHYVRSLYQDDLLASPYTDLALRHLGDGSIRDNYVRPHYVLLPTYDYGTYVIFTRTSDHRVPLIRVTANIRLWYLRT